MKDGRIFYQGPVNNIVDYYKQRGLECPSNYNPSDFVMNITQSETAEELANKKLFMEKPEDCCNEVSSKLKIENVVFQTESSFAKQFYYLTVREFRNTKRDVAALIGRFGVTILLNLLIGLIFLRAAGQGNTSDDDFNAHVGGITMVIIMSLFGSAQSILLNFPYERPMFLREYSTGTCKC